MEHTNYETFIIETVEAMLPRFSDMGIVLTMGINSYYKIFKSDDSFNEGEKFLLAFSRPSNYTKVFFNKIKNDENIMFSNLERYDEMKFELLSDHDTCWTSDGMRWIFKSYTDLRDKAINNGFGGMFAKTNENWRFSFDIFGGGPQYYEVEYMKEIEKYNWSIKFKRNIKIKDVGKFLGNDI